MSDTSSFEVLAEYLVPTAIIPSGPQFPFLVQGYFVQLSLVAGQMEPKWRRESGHDAVEPLGRYHRRHRRAG